ncbi:hypothetical protein M0802_003375 [Mischocyttarus mexicanus]|nr:hypothetical protein M0802_003375 [Mischocyttarus mexicanus]
MGGGDADGGGGGGGGGSLTPSIGIVIDIQRTVKEKCVCFPVRRLASKYESDYDILSIVPDWHVSFKLPLIVCSCNLILTTTTMMKTTTTTTDYDNYDYDDDNDNDDDAEEKSRLNELTKRNFSRHSMSLVTPTK